MSWSRISKKNLTPEPLRISGVDLWKVRFRAPSIASTQVAAQVRTRGLVVHNKSGAYQYYAWDIPKSEMRQLTKRPEGTGLQAFPSPDGRYVYYLDDTKGNETGHFVRVRFDGGEPEDITPDLPFYSNLAGDPSFAMSRSGNLIGLTADSPDGFHLYCIDVEPDGKLGRPRLLRSSKRLAAGPHISRNGKIAFWASTERSHKLQYSLLAIDTGTGEQIAELWDGPESSLDYVAAIVSPIKGDSRILTATNRTGVEKLLVWNPITGEREDLSIEDIEGSMRAFDWSPDGERILFRTFNHAVQQLYVYNLVNRKVSKLNHPGGTNSGPYFWTNREIWSHWQDPAHPPCLIALDAESGIQTRTVLVAGDVPPEHPFKSVTFVSSDGQEIQGWLGIPNGAGPFPTILATHGGPEAVSSLEFSPESQAWIDHGFAFLAVNYRGSVTFGREFQQKIWGNPGYWEVEDMVAAHDWLVKEGVAEPNKIFLTGWSYGGYLTLLALGKRPDLWAGGMAGVAIADWAMLYEDASNAMKGFAVALLGGTPLENPQQYAVSSPINYTEHVEAPVLIVQGRNDSRTPARPVEAYEAKMKALNKQIEVHWFNAGHLGSFAQVEKSIEHQQLMLRFAQNVLINRKK